MGTMDSHKFIACRRGWVNQKTAKDRMDWASVTLERYPQPEDWCRVRFGDEVHSSYGPQDKLDIIRKPGIRYCQDYIQEHNEPAEKDKKWYHYWAAVGHNFKSEIYFYEVLDNMNGQMSQQIYIDQILEPIVMPWIQAHQYFVLEEDGNSGHGPGKSSILRTWKGKNGLESQLNCHNSPDLAPIENCWQPVKQTLCKYPHWDDATTKELIYEGWTHVNQRFINEEFSSMPKRLQAVLDGERKMTGHLYCQKC